MRFADLLAPTTVDEFVAAYSERRAHYIAGTPEKIGGLFDRARLSAILGARGHRTLPALTAGFRDAAGEHREMAIEPGQLDAVVAAGMTVMIDHLEVADDSLRALVEDARRTLGIPEAADIGAFLSPSSSGFGLHFDSVPNCVIQIEGRKRWRYGERPAVEHPTATFTPNARERAAHIHGLDEDALSSVDLAPGDVLYLPPGAWHQPVSLEEISLHLSLIVRPQSRVSFFERVVALPSSWRRLPWGSPDEVEQTLARDRDELVAALQAIEPRALRDAWQAMLPPAEPSPITVERSTRLRRTRPVRYAAEGRDDDEILLLIDDERVIARLPAAARPFLERLAAQDELVAHDATAWSDYAWDEVQAVLGVLVALGFLAVGP